MTHTHTQQRPQGAGSVGAQLVEGDGRPPHGSVSRVYAPNEYTIYLSPSDREQFASYEESLRNELQDYLGEHAKRERYALLSRARRARERRRPRGRRVRDRDPPGQQRPKLPEEPPAGPPPERRWSTKRSTPRRARPPHRRPRPSNRGRHARRERETARRRRRGGADRALEGLRHPATDPNVSRRHAEVRPEGMCTAPRPRLDERGRGRRQAREALPSSTDGDRFTVGSTEIVFSRGDSS